MKHKLLIFAIALSVIAVLPLFQSGLHPTHDGEYHVVRFYEFDKTLRSGSMYPVWAASFNYGYGVPFFTYVYPLPNYVASFFHLFNISFIDQFKLSLIAATLVGAVSSYYLGKQKFGEWGGLLTSVFYTYAPYHFLDIYIRGSVGEVWALAFFPLPLICINKILKKPGIMHSLLLGVTLSLVIFSHNILSLMYAVFLSSYVLIMLLFTHQRVQKVLYLSLGGIISLLLSVVFFIPALLEQRYVEGLNTFKYSDHFPEIYQLLIPSWGSDYSGVASATQMSFQIGAANLFLVSFVICALLCKKVKKDRAYILFFLIWFFVLCYLMTSYSSAIWEFVSFMGYFQFPWRLLSLVILCCAILAGSITHISKNKFLYILFLIFIIATTYGYASTPYMLDRTDEYYTQNSNYIHGTNSIGNGFQTKWLSQAKSLPHVQGNFIKSNGQISVRNSSSIYKSYSIKPASKSEIVLNIAYFPGWRAYVDGQEVEVINNDGKIGVQVLENSRVLEIRFEDTPVRFISKIISITTFIIVLVFILKYTVIQWFHGYRNR